MQGSAQIEVVRRALSARVAGRIFKTTNAKLAERTPLVAGAIHRVLICRPNHRLGNLLLLTPLVAELERTLPHAEIDLVLAGDHGAELFLGYGNVRHIYVLAHRVVRHPIATARIVRQIRRAHYDLAIDPCEASQSARLLLVLARAQRAVGLAHGAPAVTSGGVDAQSPAPPHMAHWPVFLLRRALAPATLACGDCPALDIRLSAAEQARGQATLDGLLKGHPRSPATPVISVFAEATGAKRYPRDWWQRCLAALRGQRPRWVFIEILPPNGRPCLALDLPTFCSESPRAVAAVIAHTTCCLSADCGVMHLASASGTPTIGLFKASNESRYAPYGHHSLAFTTHGKSPEDVARAIGVYIQALLLESMSVDTPSFQSGHGPAAAGPIRAGTIVAPGTYDAAC